MSACSLRILPLETGYLDEAVTIHLAGFPDFFLSFLGRDFLIEFYSAFLDDPVGIGFVACDPSGSVLGVIVGCQDPSGFFGRLVRRRWWAFCMASLSAIVKRPSCFPRLFRAFFYRGSFPAGPPRSLLSSIVVAPHAQSGGVGKMLIQAWLKELQLRGSTGAYLITDANENEAVISFYLKNSWEFESSHYTKEGRLMQTYVLNFPTQALEEL